MIIKLTPETDAERESLQEVEHHHVKDFMIFGTKQDADGDVLDFYDWRGSYKFLISNIAWHDIEIRREYENRQNSMGEVPRMSLGAPADGDKPGPSLKVMSNDVSVPAEDITLDEEMEVEAPVSDKGASKGTDDGEE